MRKLSLIAAAALMLALAGPAAAKPQVYKGKTSSGHPITAKINKGIVRHFVAGIAVTCIPIQGTTGRPSTGAETFGFESTIIKVKKRHHRFTFMRKPAYHWREVTTNHDLWIKRRGNRISGRMRIQYSYMVSTFPIGTFNIYSCLGSGKFKAKARR
jgi:hypothetical protein